MCVILRTNAKIEAKKQTHGFPYSLTNLFWNEKKATTIRDTHVASVSFSSFFVPFLCHCLPNRGSVAPQTKWYSTWCTVGGFRMCHDSIVASNLSHWGVTCVDTIFVVLLFNRYPLLYCDLIIVVMKLFRILFNILLSSLFLIFLELIRFLFNFENLNLKKNMKIFNSCYFYKSFSLLFEMMEKLYSTSSNLLSIRWFA